MNKCARLVKLLKGIHRPEIFLPAAAIGSFAYLYSFLFGSLISIAIIFLFFNLRQAFLLTIFLLASLFINSHSAFILNNVYEKKDHYHTTKGYMNIIMPLKAGDFIWGGFTAEVDRTTILPRLKYKPSEEYKIYRIPLISAILETRVKHSSSLMFGSGGKITTTQAHIFAVRDYISDDMKDMYVITGLSHLLAMSGFHAGIFAGGFLLIFSFIPFKPRVLLVAPLMLLLIPVSGFAVTVVRAVAFTLVYFIAISADLKVDSLRFTAFLAGIILLFSPFSLFSISFMLSFLAVYGILLIAKRYNGVKSIFIIGVASTIFTLPVQLYFFGTANIMSVITTAVLTPFVWLQMMLGLLSLPLGDIIIPPLAYLEVFIAAMMKILSDFSWHFLYVSKPPVVLLASTFVICALLSFTKLKYLTVAMLFLPFLPVYENNTAIFPMLPPSPKGYVLKTDEFSEIFYQGTHSSFVRYMVPAAGRLGIKEFDYGSIRIFNGNNLYLKIKNEHLSGKICVNDDGEDCPIVYYTRSNSINKSTDPNKIYVIYKNKTVENNIYLTNESEVKLYLKHK